MSFSERRGSGASVGELESTPRWFDSFQSRRSGSPIPGSFFTPASTTDAGVPASTDGFAEDSKVLFPSRSAKYEPGAPDYDF